MRVIDLFSGLGGFSEAFVQRGHDVIRYDNDERFADIPYTCMMDIMDLETLPDADIVLASPPCNCFSRMTIRYYWENKRPKNDKARFAVALVKKTKNLIDSIAPRFYIIENPIGMMIHVLGKPQMLTWWAAWYSEYDEGIPLDNPPLKETYLWGRLPHIVWPKKPTKYARVSRKGKNRQQGVQGIKDSAISAKIPYLFSEALAIPCEIGTYQVAFPLEG
jgi:hypothetical protein